MSEKFMVIVYDISNDRRRTKLHGALLNYDTPVQYSVFGIYSGPPETIDVFERNSGFTWQPNVNRLSR